MEAILCLVTVGLVISVLETITVKTRLIKHREIIVEAIANELRKTKEELIKANKDQIQGELIKLAVTPIVINLTGKKSDKQ